MDKKDENVVDLFSEELEKKDKKLEKKVAKEKKKEMKKKKKKEKELEKKEDLEFAKKLEEMKEEQEEIPLPKKEDIRNKKMADLFKTTRIERLEQTLEQEKNIEEKKHPFLNALLIIFSIALFVITCDYLIYNIYTNYVDLPTMINSILLSCMVVFYILSIIIKKSGPKKFFELLSIICVGLFMTYNLYIA